MRSDAREAAIKATRPPKLYRSPGFLTNSKGQRFAESVEFGAQRIDGWLSDAIDTRDREDLVKQPIKSRASRCKKGGQGALAVGRQFLRKLAKLVKLRRPLLELRECGFSGSRIADPLQVGLQPGKRGFTTRT